MKKLLLCGFVLILMCVMPVGALKAVTDYYSYHDGGCIHGYPEYLGNVLENDIPSSPLLTVEITEMPKHGFAKLEPNGELRYNNEDKDFFTGTDYLRYRIINGTSYSNNATVYINVFPYGDRQAPPIRQWFYTQKNTEIKFSGHGICGDDPGEFTEISSDVNHGKLISLGYPDGEPFSSVFKSKESFEDEYAIKAFKYVPDTGFMGWDGFTYRCLYESANDGDCYTPKSGIAIYVGTPPYPTPEFPSVFLPATMIIGFFGAVLLIRRTRE